MRTFVILVALFILTISPAPLTAGNKTDVLKAQFGSYQLGDDTLANEVHNAGMSYIIRMYRWAQLEPEQDVFNFNEIDSWYNDILEPNGLGAIILLRTGQNWATDNQYDPELGTPLHELASAPPLNYSDYYDYIHETVDHLKGRINIFIIENDPLTKISWYGTAEEYKLLTSVAYLAAKNANPECIVIGNKFPALAFGHLIARDLLREGHYQAAINFWNGYHSRRDESFQVANLSELLDKLNNDFSFWLDEFANSIMTPDQAANLDAIGFNYYLHYDYIDEVVDWLNIKMATNGFSLPIWDLEHGIKDEREEVSDFTAAGELVKGYVITQSLGVPYIAWYPFTIDSTGHNFEDLKPMWDYPNQEFLPPYLAMQILSRHITPSHIFQGALFTTYSRYAYRNIRTSRVDLDIIWSDAVNEELSLLFRPQSTQAIVTHFLGNSVETIPNVNDTLVVDVNFSPRYIKWLFADE